MRAFFRGFGRAVNMMADSGTAIGRVFDVLFLSLLAAMAFRSGGEGSWGYAGWFAGLAIAYVLQNMLPGVRVEVRTVEGMDLKVVHGTDARVNSEQGAK